MAKYEYSIYKKAAKQGGWSHPNKLDNTTKWGDFYEYVKKKVNKNDIVIDIGTAEGNNLLRLAPKIKKAIGIDVEPDMIRLAKQNKKLQKITNVIFRQMDANHLDFPDEYFDLAIIKHSPINFLEVYRILKKDGRCITQQVHETDKQNLKHAFGRGQGYNKKSSALLKKYKQQARNAGFIHIKSKISNIPYYFKSESHLRKFLNKTPTIHDFGKKNDEDTLKRFILQHKNARGIKSNTSRFLLEMVK